jgi:predicted RNase H-like HicB family nuclease
MHLVLEVTNADGGGWIATAVDLPDVFAHAASREEAIACAEAIATELFEAGAGSDAFAPEMLSLSIRQVDASAMRDRGHLQPPVPRTHARAIHARDERPVRAVRGIHLRRSRRSAPPAHHGPPNRASSARTRRRSR